ncbi:MAG: hypothetical protein K1X29_04155 [Bdellovibrionales bacterium]|nr:hypothetical protein [Bdellovibrionales bacterium]
MKYLLFAFLGCSFFVPFQNLFAKEGFISSHCGSMSFKFLQTVDCEREMEIAFIQNPYLNGEDVTLTYEAPIKKSGKYLKSIRFVCGKGEEEIRYSQYEFSNFSLSSTPTYYGTSTIFFKKNGASEQYETYDCFYHGGPHLIKDGWNQESPLPEQLFNCGKENYDIFTHEQKFYSEYNQGSELSNFGPILRENPQSIFLKLNRYFFSGIEVNLENSVEVKEEFPISQSTTKTIFNSSPYKGNVDNKMALIKSDKVICETINHQMKKYLRDQSRISN